MTRNPLSHVFHLCIPIALLLASPPAHAEYLVLFGARIPLSAERRVPTPGDHDADPATLNQTSSDPQPLEILDMDDAMAALDTFPTAPHSSDTGTSSGTIPADRQPSIRPSFLWVGDDEIEIRTAGLNSLQVSRVMEELEPGFRACISPTQPIAGELELDITVAQDGSVRQVSTLSTRGAGPGRVAPDASTETCVEQVVAGAQFPKHQLSEGFPFQYVLRMDFN